MARFDEVCLGKNRAAGITTMALYERTQIGRQRAFMYRHKFFPRRGSNRGRARRTIPACAPRPPNYTSLRAAVRCINSRNWCYYKKIVNGDVAVFGVLGKLRE